MRQYFFMGLPRILLILSIVNVLYLGYLSSQLNYNSQINHANQNNLLRILNQQGNVSDTQRSTLIKEFENVSSQGGFSTASQAMQNHHLLLNINHTVNILLHLHGST